MHAGAGIAIAVGLGQLLRLRLQGGPIASMQWMSLALVIVLGGATVLPHTPRLMLVKPSIGHFAVAAIMLRRGWMAPYLPPVVQQHVPPAVIVAAGDAWAALLAALGTANLFFAIFADLSTWAWFASFGAIGTKGGGASGAVFGIPRHRTAANRCRAETRTGCPDADALTRMVDRRPRPTPVFFSPRRTMMPADRRRRRHD